MKRLVAVLAAGALAATLFAVFTPESHAGYPPDPYTPNPFVGAWESTDIDGSYQRLSIGMGTPPDPYMGYPPDPVTPSFHIVYFDHDESSCDGAAIAIGMSVPPDPVTPNILEAEVSGWCLSSHTVVDGQILTLTYAPDGGHLIQETEGGVIFWRRQAPNMGPAPHPPPE